MDLIQIWHAVVASFEGVPYFKVTLNSHEYKTYVQFTCFAFSMEYTESNFRNFILYFCIYMNLAIGKCHAIR